MIIGIDIDGTLFDIMTPLLKLYNLEKGTKFKSNQIKEYKADEYLGLDKDLFRHLINDVWVNHSDKIKLFEEGINFNKLRKRNKHKIIIFTKRDLHTIPYVIRKLDECKITVDGIIAVNNGLKKEDIKGIDMLLDDSKEIVDSINNSHYLINGCSAYLIKRSYNKKYDVKTIQEFIDKVITGELKHGNKIRKI